MQCAFWREFGTWGRGIVLTCTTILCRQITGTIQALQDKMQLGIRTTVRKPGGVEHMRIGLERSTSISRMTLSHCICQEEACSEIIHVNWKYHLYEMQVVQRPSDTDKITARMHHLLLVTCKGHQGHVTLTATDFFFQNYLREVFAWPRHNTEGLSTWDALFHLLFWGQSWVSLHWNYSSKLPGNA